ncbi:MAG: MOSC domain-containing protein [Fulvivirga sp.]|nr:MOSC domain-containing protein [Fulvivirga sp.]
MSSKKYLKAIYIYPIKSLPGVRVDAAWVMQKGLNYDRRWMLVDEHNQFISLRKERKLVKFHLTINPRGFNISSHFLKSSIELPHSLDDGKEIKAKIWDDEVMVIEDGHGWSKWFSEALERPCKLVYFPEKNQRPVNEKYQIQNESVSLADGYPYLIAGQESLGALNQQLPEPIGIERFRPNLVFNGGKPFEEFEWKNFTIGNVRFQGLKPCERCVVTTIDPKTGEKGKEPLRSLAKRKVNDKIVFGQHALALEDGEIKMGDEIAFD